jgi:opacity protein-like surface antigen
MYKNLKNLMAILILVPGAGQFAHAEHDWTVAVHAGQADLDVRTVGDHSLEGRIDDDSSIVGISLAYQFIRPLSVRLMYERATGFDGYSTGCPAEVCITALIPDSADLDIWTLAATPRLHLNEQWSLYGVIGASRFNISTSGQLPGDSGTEFTVGAGVAWRPAPQFELGLEYQHAGIDYNA